MKFILVQIWQNTQKANLQYTYLDIDLGEPFLVSFHNPFQTLYYPVYFECTENLTNKNLIGLPKNRIKIFNKPVISIIFNGQVQMQFFFVLSTKENFTQLASAFYSQCTHIKEQKAKQQ